jgi:glutamate 5-kinase
VINSVYPSIVVKVGTNVLTTADGLLNSRVVRALVRQIAALMKGGTRIVLVTSGAMGAGRALVKPSRRLGAVTQRQVLAAVGQIRLIEIYARYFAKEGVTCAQVLATKEDFRDRHHYLNMRNCLTALQSEQVVPIVNENDVVAVEELMFSDNDELAGLLASMMEVDALILLTNVDGVCDGDPADPGTRVIGTMPPEPAQWARLIQPHKSAFGRGGMLTKCATAHRLSRLGITTHICNGLARGVVTRVCAGERIGTVFAASRRSLTGKKRWMAGGASGPKGSVTINEGARRAITSGQRVASLLPIGLTAVEGDFDRGDIIRIRSESGHEIGLGVAGYGAGRVREVLGKKGQKALVHYDHLYLVD